MKSSINPRIIKWARERAGFTPEQLAVKMRREPSEIKSWESGQDSPSYSTLEKLAYSHLKVPIAVFFFPEPPDIDDPVRKLRRLPDHEFDRFSPNTYQKFLLGQAYQDSLSSLISDFPKKKVIFYDFSPEYLNPVDFAKKAREYLGISLAQQNLFSSCETAFKAWRHVLEESSIYTFKDSFEDKFISGFSLLDDEYPIIFINNSNAFSRQIFTLIHELGHILYGVSGITDIDESYIDFLSDEQRALEVKCNKFAANFLVPDEAFKEDILFFKAAGHDSISDIADKYSVSREVILRRLLDNGVVDIDFYKQSADEWNQEYLRRERSTTGGNYYLTRLAYLGEGYAKVAFSTYYRGRITRTELANHLNIKARYLPRIESYMRW
jgi:Zn-dependent peptidase ImmA (M78 family)